MNILFLLTFLFSFLALPVSAQRAERMDPTLRAQRVSTQSARRIENKCSAIESRVRAHVNNLSVRKDNHIEVYRSAHTRWLELADRLTSQGYDTAIFRTHLATLTIMIEDLATDYSQFVIDAEKSLTFDCMSQMVNFKGQMNSSRQSLATFRTSAKQIHDYIKNVIRADLRALRQQKATITPTPTVTQ